MDTTQVTLADGGYAFVVTGPDVDCPRPYDMHPQLCVVPSTELPSTLPDMLSRLPANTRMIMIGGELTRNEFSLVKEAAARRSLPWVHRPKEAGLKDTLARVLARSNGATTAADAAEPGATKGRKHGAVTEFVLAECDLTKGAAEEARRLMPIAQQRNINTTFGSLSQAISNAKRKAQATGVPKSIQPASVKALNTLNDSIAGLQLLVEYVEQVEKENHQLRADKEALRARLKKTLAAVQDLSMD